MRKRRIVWVLGTVLPVLACSAAGQDDGLAASIARFPPLIIGPGISATGVDSSARSCPATGSRVEQRGGPTIRYDGADPANSDLCRIRFDGQPAEAWFGIWLTSWPGAEEAHVVLDHLIHGRAGDTEGFTVRMAPGLAFHDILRNEGIENLSLLGRAYRTLKISHYREGILPNTYRSVVTGWKDLGSGMMVYVTYQHISGAPEINTPLDPTAIVSAR